MRGKDSLPLLHGSSSNMWYGLVVNGTLSAVRWFRDPPLIWDFHSCYFSGWVYEVVEVSVVVTGVVPECM